MFTGVEGSKHRTVLHLGPPNRRRPREDPRPRGIHGLVHKFRAFPRQDAGGRSVKLRMGKKLRGESSTSSDGCRHGEGRGASKPHANAPPGRGASVCGRPRFGPARRRGRLGVSRPDARRVPGALRPAEAWNPGRRGRAARSAAPVHARPPSAGPSPEHRRHVRAAGGLARRRRPVSAAAGPRACRPAGRRHGRKTTGSRGRAAGTRGERHSAPPRRTGPASPRPPRVPPPPAQRTAPSRPAPHRSAPTAPGRLPPAPERGWSRSPQRLPAPETHQKRPPCSPGRARLRSPSLPPSLRTDTLRSGSARFRPAVCGFPSPGRTPVPGERFRPKKRAAREPAARGPSAAGPRVARTGRRR